MTEINLYADQFIKLQGVVCVQTKIFTAALETNDGE
jgi:hypothetical protein